jgi:hypothetical protein
MLFKTTRHLGAKAQYEEAAGVVLKTRYRRWQYGWTWRILVSIYVKGPGTVQDQKRDEHTRDIERGDADVEEENSLIPRFSDFMTNVLLMLYFLSMSWILPAQPLFYDLQDSSWTTPDKVNELWRYPIFSWCLLTHG